MTIPKPGLRTPDQLTAATFAAQMETFRCPAEALKLMRYFKTGKGEYGEGDVFLGIRMGDITALAKAYVLMPLEEIEKLLFSPIHEIRSGALNMMNLQARSKKTSLAQRRQLFELYLRRTDRINNWDLVDVCAPHVIGGYLFLSGKSREVLYKLAKSANIWERRTAIVSTQYFIRQGDIADTFRISELLLSDSHDLIHKATGWMLRSAGEVNRPQLCVFLDKFAAVMPRTMLRYSLEHFSQPERAHYMALKGTV